MIKHFDHTQNFWALHKDLSIIEPFKSLYDNDKSKNKDKSSSMMWFVAYTHDSESKFSNADKEEMYRMIGRDYFQNPKFFQENKEALTNIISMYEHLDDNTAAKRGLRAWNKTIEKRIKFLDSTDYTLGVIGERGGWVGGTADVLDKMMANTKKLYDDYQRIMEDLDKEEAKTQTKGGKQPSLTDQGLI